MISCVLVGICEAVPTPQTSMVRIAIVLLGLFFTRAEERASCRGRCNLLMLRA